MRYLCCCLLFASYAFCCVAQPNTSAFLKNELAHAASPLLKEVLAHPEAYHYQVIYTKIDRDQYNNPSFTHYFYNVDASQYFNPASTVKMPLAFLALEKANQLKQYGVSKYSPMQFDSGYIGQQKMLYDSTAESGLPSLAHFIKKVFLISDNEAYNRLYEFVGQQAINRGLHARGYTDSRITRRFIRMTPEQNRHTNPIHFMDAAGKVIYQQPPQYNSDVFDFSAVHKLGMAHYNAQDSLVQEPFDFTTHNNLPLQDLQQLLQSVLFPASVPASKRFNLQDEDYDFLYRYLSQYPSETSYPKYDTAQYFDSYVKFMFKDGGHTIPANIRVFNKVGWSYGCMTDVSYVADFDNKVEFMLAATIYVNKDEVINDDKYEYNQVALPFFYALGQHLYQYELKRKRAVKPDLSRFKLIYKPRQPDSRPSITDAAN
ncbi:MAG: hypothetical protein RL172_1300 [Bacteroidota bacterium]|jgi:hypothetical protein